MKKYLIIYLLLILFSLKVFAEDSKVPIKTLIENIKKAKVKDRRKLMNQLKLRLRDMNKNNRKKAMKELKKSFNIKNKQKIKKRKKIHKRRPKYRPIRRHQNRRYR